MQVIRVLWGEDGHPSRRRCIKDIKKYATKRHGEWSVPFVVYCYGDNNQQLVDSLGFKSIRISDRSQEFAQDNGTNWTHKHHAITQAVDEHGEILYMDWDVRQACKLDEQFYDRIRDGRSVQVSLTRYKRAYATWRSKRADMKLLPSGAFIYLAGDEVSKSFLRLVASFLPHTINRSGKNHYHDEYAMAMAAEELSGGWKGAEHWCQNYEPKVVGFRRGACDCSRITDQSTGQYFMLR